MTRAQAMGDGEACLVTRNDPMHDSVAYLRNNLPAETDILHEYFVPRERIVPFIDALRAVFRAQDVNLVNASIRAVEAEHNALSYAPAPAFSVVLYINQSTDAEGTARMARLTSDLIDLTSRHGGRFFLPYQLHYTRGAARALLSRDPAPSSPPSGAGTRKAGSATAGMRATRRPCPRSRRQPALDDQPGAGAVERGRVGRGRGRRRAAPRPPGRPPAAISGRRGAASPTTATWRPDGPRKGMATRIATAQAASAKRPP